MIHRGYFFVTVLVINRRWLLELLDYICDTEICVQIVLQKNGEADYWKLSTFYTGYTYSK